MTVLNTIAQDYTRGELTSAWVHDRAQKRHVLVFAVAELCPNDQPTSPRLGAAPYFQVRERVEGDVRTLYVRRDTVSTTDAIAFYRGAAGAHTIVAPDNPPAITPASKLSELNVDEEPILLPSNLAEAMGVGAVLPSRPTSVAVLSKYDTGGATQTWLADEGVAVVVAGVRRHLGVDLSRFHEHLGSLHLCFGNPVLRRYERSITADERALLVRFYERAGRTIVGGQIELLNEWTNMGSGFSHRQMITSPFLAIPMPARPQHLRVRVIDVNGRCVEDDSGVFLREFRVDVGLGSRRRVTYTSPGRGDESFDVQTVSYDASCRFVERDVTPAEHLAEATRSRELDDLAAARIFLYFPGGERSRLEALAVVRELVGKARERCDIVDPYLSADDAAMVVPFVQTTNCPVRLLSSRAYLHQRTEDDATREARLAARVAELAAQLPFKLEAKQLEGTERSPVHDRMLVIDNDVYLLGSSLSEFGSRATTVFRVPDPRTLRDEVDTWWARAAALDAKPTERTVRAELVRLKGQLRNAAATARDLLRLIGRRLRKGSP